MNPRIRECFGLHGYGSGYYAKESDLATKMHHYAVPVFYSMYPQYAVPVFCSMCPQEAECWRSLLRKTRLEDPEACENFDRKLHEAGMSGKHGGMVAAEMMANGTPDPFMAQEMANIQQGMNDRALEGATDEG